MGAGRLLLVLALGGVAAGCGRGGAAAGAAAPDTVVLSASDVQTVALGRVEAGVLLTGSLDPRRVVKLTAQVSGTVRDIRVDRGSQVTRGAALATIEAAGELKIPFTTGILVGIGETEQEQVESLEAIAELQAEIAADPRPVPPPPPYPVKVFRYPDGGQ